MKIERFNTHHDGFDVLDIRAHFNFKSATSICFDLGLIPKGQIARVVFGALQVHHPCKQHIRAYIHVQLPRRYAESQVFRQLSQAILRELDIPHGETWELRFNDSADAIVMSQRVDCEGYADTL